MKKDLKETEKRISTNTGNAGEHLVMAELLIQNYQAFMADRANAAFDIAVYKNGKHSLVRVKTTRNGDVQYSTKKDGETIFLDMKKARDFVIIVNFSSRNKNKDLVGARVADFYIVPTYVVNKALADSHTHWHSFKKRDGQERKVTNHRMVSLHGNDTETNAGRGYDKKWKKYHEAWHQFG